MSAEELLVNDGSKRKSVKCGHANIVKKRRVLLHDFSFESEMLGEVTAFMITSK